MLPKYHGITFYEKPNDQFAGLRQIFGGKKCVESVDAAATGAEPDRPLTKSFLNCNQRRALMLWGEHLTAHRNTDTGPVSSFTTRSGLFYL